MKKILIGLIVAFISIYSFAQDIANEKELGRYLREYGKDAALFELCGEPDIVDIANIGIYFDEILTPKFLKQQVKKYGSQQKAAFAAIDIANKASRKEKHRLIDKGFSIDDCKKIYDKK